MTDDRPEVANLRLPLDRLPDPLPIPTLRRPFDAVIRPPGSKSITNRALLLAALANGESILRGPLIDADDSRVMIEALQALGAEIDEPGDGTLRVRGVNGRWRPRAGGAPSERRIVLNLRNAGTATRFLAAAAMLAPEGAEIVIDGDPRMRERPIGELVDAIRLIDGPDAAKYLGREGFPPIAVRPVDVAARSGVTVRFSRTLSSQFISAVMLVGPFVPAGFRIEFDEAITSEPYVKMTARLLERLGATVIDELPSAISVMPTGLRDGLPGFDLAIEPDASGATYWLAAAAMTPGSRVVVPDLDARPGLSLQGDAAFIDLLERMGANTDRHGDQAVVRSVGAKLRAIHADLSGMPDTAMTLAAACCTADGPSTLRGLRTLRVKETDRLAALATELTKIGATITPIAERSDEGISITPPPAAAGTSRPVEFGTYNDHRMAMSLALIGLGRGGISIRDPRCVAKTYPTFWSDFARLYG